MTRSNPTTSMIPAEACLSLHSCAQCLEHHNTEQHNQDTQDAFLPKLPPFYLN